MNSLYTEKLKYDTLVDSHNGFTVRRIARTINLKNYNLVFELLLFVVAFK